MSKSRKSVRKAQRKKATLAARYPDKCFCSGLRTGCNDDEFIRYSEPILWPPLQTKLNRYAIRRCSVCGKEYTDAPSMA